ncbi:dihydropyrimidinase [Gemmobacter nectariphilus]|uniref:dihydropyrimidinase n=1 Tax=Gemmobacter nectariphilus TaxID=220343 RepID=UPI000413D14C|nr:dihydropyrimidinase [Gemmobacter nectariphilus]
MDDLIVAGGTVIGPDGRMAADVVIRDGRIVLLGDAAGLPGRRIDATGHLVMPGGVDSHCHIEQLSGAGLMNADTFETATRSALRGGTTTTVSFAAQHPGMRLADVVADYEARAVRGALGDYAFHTIVSDISGDNLSVDLPALLARGHRSVKIFTVYDKVRVADEAILDILHTVRQGGGIVCVHAENDGMIRWMMRNLVAAGQTAPRYHALAPPRLAEVEALNRICRFAEFMGQPVMLFHISCAEGLAVVREARARGVPVVAETCPHYLFQTVDVLEGPDAAGYLCSPPQRLAADQAALWGGLETGDLAAITSDHAPYRLDASGKFAHGADAPFPRLANGQPGLEMRLPLMFDAMVSDGRLGPERFVELTATAPARIFGLTGKGRIAPGMDADIAIWNPARQVTLGKTLDGAGYNPWAGRQVTGWPETVIRRGDIVVQEGRVLASPGSGRRIPMALSPAMAPRPPMHGLGG